jgi:hypothetical protein
MERGFQRYPLSIMSLMSIMFITSVFIPYHVHITRLRGVFTSLRLCIMQCFHLTLS